MDIVVSSIASTLTESFTELLSKNKVDNAVTAATGVTQTGPFQDILGGIQGVVNNPYFMVIAVVGLGVGGYVVLHK